MVDGELTILGRIEIDHIANANVNNSQETLILLLKLLLIKHLYRENAILRRTPVSPSAKPSNPQSHHHNRSSITHISNVSFQYGFSVRLITDVVFVCSPLSVATAKGSGKPSTRHHESAIPPPSPAYSRAGRLESRGGSKHTEHLALV